MASSSLDWPELSFPPINLLVLPAWQQHASVPTVRRAGNRPTNASRNERLNQLLADRGGRRT